MGKAQLSDKQPFKGRFCDKDGRKPGAADKDTALPTPATHDRKVRLKTGEKKGKAPLLTNEYMSLL